MQRFLNRAAEAVKKIESTRVLLVLLVALVAFGFLFAVRQHVKQPNSGDEPHYLLMDYSMVHDRDLDLKNNYQNYDYFRYYPAPTETHVSPLNLDDPSSGWYSFHGMGLPVLILPAFMLNERLGPIIFMTLIAAITVLLAWAWAAQVTKNRRAGLLAALTLMVCYFFAGLAGYIYPDLVTASLVLGALIILYGYFKRPLFQAVFGALLGVMVIVHPKTLTIAVPLALILAFRLWRAEKKLPWAMLLAALPFALFFMITLERWYGVWNPGAIYPSNVIISASQVLSIPAALFDSKHGVLIYSPVLLLLFVGLPIWYKKNRTSLLIAALGLLPAIAITLSFNQWQGGWAPAGRYLMNFIPAFVPALAFVFLALKTRWQKITVWTLVGVTAFITLFAVAIKMPYPAAEPRPQFFVELQEVIGIPFDKLLPKFSIDTQLTGRFDWFKVIVGITLVAACVWYGRKLAKNVKAERPNKL